MTSIVKATPEHSELLAAIGKQSFIESHGHSAPAADINAYVNKNYSETIIKTDLDDPGNIYHIIYDHGEPAGYSKIIFHAPNTDIPNHNITKMERLYLLKEFYHLRLGAQLFSFNLKLSKQHQQAGMWLYVWKENARAFDFYIRNGFVIAGSFDFRISSTHSNPNHLMFLKY